MVKLQFAYFHVENQIGVEKSQLLMNTGMKHCKCIIYEYK
jgi:uncharacterized protein YoaH (UPF0181 family)